MGGSQRELDAAARSHSADVQPWDSKEFRLATKNVKAAKKFHKRKALEILAPELAIVICVITEPRLSFAEVKDLDIEVFAVVAKAFRCDVASGGGRPSDPHSTSKCVCGAHTSLPS